MRILIFGAGVLGSLYGARLAPAHDVTLLARGDRGQDLRDHGVRLRHALSGEPSVSHVRVIEHLAPPDRYDLVVVLVRKTQLPGALPVLAANVSPSLLFLVNTASGYDDLRRAVGAQRVLVGFAGAGGTLRDGIVEYTVAPRLIQPTTFGEPDGEVTPRLKAIAATFRDAGFPVALERNMDAWQKTHVAWVSPTANAIYAAAGDTRRLAATPEAIALMLGAIRESFRALRALGIPITPSRLRVLERLPQRLTVQALPPLLASRRADIMLARHANAARDEMAQLAGELAELARRSGVATPHLDELARFVDPSVPPLAARCGIVGFPQYCFNDPAYRPWGRSRGRPGGRGGTTA